jgi:hypothetical protein
MTQGLFATMPERADTKGSHWSKPVAPPLHSTVEHFSVGFIEPPSEKCSVPRPVSTSSGDAMPGSIGVVSLYCFGGWEREVINSR